MSKDDVNDENEVTEVSGAVNDDDVDNGNADDDYDNGDYH